MDHKLLMAGESLSAPCFAAMKHPAKIYYLSDASFDAIDGFCRKLRIYGRYDLSLALSAELKRKAARRETCSVTINLLELVGMVLTVWVMHDLVEDHPESKGDPILMRGDSFAAVTWANRCGGARDKRAGLMMRMLGRLEIQGGWRNGGQRGGDERGSSAFDGVASARICRGQYAQGVARKVEHVA